MSIVRVVKEENYTVIANEPLNDSRLSWSARGMLAYLLTKPDHWSIRMEHLINQSPGSRTLVRRIFKELSEAGYMTRERVRRDDGTFEWETVIYENPNQGTKTTGGLSTDGKPTDIVSTEEVNTKTLSPNGDEAGNPDGEKPKEEKPRITNDVRKFAEDVFRSKTGLAPLPATNKSNKSTNSTRWWTPLRTICELAEGDKVMVRRLIEMSVDDLGLDKTYAPQSLINIIPKVMARISTRRPSNVKHTQTGGINL